MKFRTRTLFKKRICIGKKIKLYININLKMNFNMMLCFAIVSLCLATGVVESQTGDQLNNKNVYTTTERTSADRRFHALRFLI